MCVCICVSKYQWVSATLQCLHYSIGSDNGLSPERRQAIIWTKAGTALDTAVLY